MKTILIATDFSAKALHAAQYAYTIAKKLGADIIICNALEIPQEIPQAGVMGYSIEQYENIGYDREEELKKMKKHFEHEDHTAGFRPKIDCIFEYGGLTTLIKKITSESEIFLMVMSTHNEHFLTTILLGNHTKRMINASEVSLLLVPENVSCCVPQRIGLAIDFKRFQEDFEDISNLVTLTKSLEAELLLAHIFGNDAYSKEEENTDRKLLADLAIKLDYDKLEYKLFQNNNNHLQSGLSWLYKNEHLDLLVMIHRKHGFLSRIINGSETQNLANSITIPLLVIPGDHYHPSN
jgi:nucleotide-binding universal stress UspA family protein